MISKYFEVVETEGADNGLITHEDQETNGLAFNFLFKYEGKNYVQVEGESANVQAWATRVSGTEVDQSTIDTVAALIPPAEEPPLV